MEFRSRPELEAPLLFAAWPGMGFVAYKTVTHLVEHLNAIPFATCPAGDRFGVRAIRIDKGLVGDLEPPRSVMLSCRQVAGKDLLFFIGEDQPVAGQEWSFATEILSAAEQFGSRMVYTFAAMPTNIDHHRDPGVWGVATHAELLAELGQHEVRPMAEGSISGLNGVLLGVAKHRGWRGCCLLGEIPLYATQMENPRSCLAILRRIASITGISVETQELELLVELSTAQLDAIFEQISDKAQDEPPPEDDDDSSPVLN